MATFGFGTITSQGIGSSLNLSGLVTQLMQVERIPLDRLIAQKTSFDAKISALGTIKSSLSSFQSALDGLVTSTTFQASSATSSDSSIIKATGTSGAVPGNYSITDLTQLAKSQKLVAAGQADATASIGAGTSTTLTINLGTTSGATFTSNADPSFDVVIDSSNNTLEGIRDAINSANGGVTATIVNDGDAANPYRLVLSSTNSGADQSMQIVVSGDATLTSLLNYDPAGAQNLAQTSIAQDANFKVDGISITKSSNTVTDVIEGVTLELAGVTAGSTVTLSVSQDTGKAKEAVKAFVDAYNGLQAEIKTQIDSGVGGGEAGALASDSLTRQIMSSIRAELNKIPTGVTGSYTTLSSVGVSFQAGGKLALDETKLDAAIQANSNNVVDLFSSADGYATRLDTVVSEMLAYNGSIDARTNAFKDRISILDDRQESIEGALSRTEERLRARFTALDVLVASLNSTNSALSQQLDSLGLSS
ncbi:MAG: flagellar filament capping protein FliD [Gammaproteobacteria bacterium]|nr:flagellar filament capping protein FliD [Gammaproteobacteria bacterium]